MTIKTRHFEVDDDDDAYDERGLLRDGHKVRVPVMMRDADSVQSAIAQEDARRHWHEQRDFAKAELSARWKGGLETGDVVRLGDRMVTVRGRSPETGNVIVKDAAKLDAETIKQEAYDAYDRDLTSAWMRDRDADEPRAGEECSYGGFSGHYERDRHGNLVCAPDDKNDRENVLAGPLSDEQRFKVKDEMYTSYERDLCDAWRR